MRGLGLPGCPLGVTVPTSTKPNPMAARPSMQRAFLSRPAARSHPVRETQASQRHRIVHPRFAPQAGQRRVLETGEFVERQFVCGFRVETEQKRAGERVGQE